MCRKSICSSRQRESRQSQKSMFPRWTSIGITAPTLRAYRRLPWVDHRSRLVHKEMQVIWSLPVTVWTMLNFNPRTCNDCSLFLHGSLAVCRSCRKQAVKGKSRNSRGRVKKVGKIGSLESRGWWCIIGLMFLAEQINMRRFP